MRLQKLSFMFAFLASAIFAQAQEGYQMKANEKYTEIDFLTSYYTQDGDNAAVTGGVGTEELTDFATMIVVNIPIDSTQSINATLGLDIYSSASTDNIDNNRSSASIMDKRAYADFGYTKRLLTKGFTYGARIGFSSEYDYTSINGGINLAQELNNGNTEFSFSAQAFLDNWKTYFPIELRGDVTVSTTSRNSYNAQLTYSQVINKRLQMSLSAEVIYMDGLLSTPFHRVYFNDEAVPDIERLPTTRLKIPFAARVNYKPTDNLVVRTYYRFYSDDFGIDAHTFNLELPYHFNDNWTVAPFYRFHTQTGSKYFAPFAEHASTDEYYTSDYDLSELNSTKYGVGIAYTPLYGVGRTKMPFTDKLLLFNSISFRVSRYTRDTGLTGFGGAIGLNFRL